MNKDHLNRHQVDYDKTAYRYAFGPDNSWPDIGSEEEIWSAVFYPTSEPGSLREECLAAALNIERKASIKGKPLMVHFSGGDDSKIMVLSMLQMGVTFELTTRVHKVRGKIINSEDVEAAATFCKNHVLDFNTHVIEDIDLEWGRTEHKFFLDMTALSVRMGVYKWPNHYHVWASNPYMMTGGDEWELFPTFTMSPNFLNSFFLDNPRIFSALLNDPAMDATVHAMNALRAVADQLPGSHRQHLGSVFAYEKIVKPMILHRAWPELSYRARVKSTGFEDAPLDMNVVPTPINSEYHRLLHDKKFTVPLSRVRAVLSGTRPMRVQKLDTKILWNEL
jgi:hypothetical protein